jgi:hypothetical protein
MHALRSSLARATPLRKTTTTTLAPRPRVRAMAAKAPDGTPLDKNTPEAVWRGILTPEEVSFWIASFGGDGRRWATERRSARVAMAARDAGRANHSPLQPPNAIMFRPHAVSTLS